MYKFIIRPLLFMLPAETAHHFSVSMLKFFYKIPGVPSLLKAMFQVNDPTLERELFGLKFKNPVGIAAGFDKDANMIDELNAMGFGFVEIGTITPAGQPGNEKPRLFRLKEDEAIINRMGFNNLGVRKAVMKLKKRKSDVIVGGNIGKNKITPNDLAIRDYLECYDHLYEYVDYFTVNVSSPNTPNLRELQEKEPLTKLLQTISDHNKTKPKPKPVLLKIAPDLTHEQLDDIIDIVETVGIDGIIATNTTVARDCPGTDWKKVNKIGAGGLSGKPVTKKSTEVIKYIYEKSKGNIPIIGVGGIFSADDAQEKIAAGATLVQVYTGFVYNGPALVKSINKSLLS